jgi:hypothetical protein
MGRWSFVGISQRSIKLGRKCKKMRWEDASVGDRKEHTGQKSHLDTKVFGEEREQS